MCVIVDCLLTHGAIINSTINNIIHGATVINSRHRHALAPQQLPVVNVSLQLPTQSGRASGEY
ncbi:MAG: hypothetical protein NTY03_06435 [Candidatus Bathyarchaeota archaeon]|nr:hypothetical protein [Candidatus Bathyarchaeota archaeon]